jgi:hypothetical protein
MRATVMTDRFVAADPDLSAPAGEPRGHHGKARQPSRVASIRRLAGPHRIPRAGRVARIGEHGAQAGSAECPHDELAELRVVFHHEHAGRLGRPHVGHLPGIGGS